MPPCPAEAGSDPALAEPRPCLLSLVLSWPTCLSPPPPAACAGGEGAAGYISAALLLINKPQ